MCYQFYMESPRHLPHPAPAGSPHGPGRVPGRAPADTARDLLAAGNVVLGPMAGITEAPFRAICKRLGAGLTYTEMVSTTGLHFNPDSPISKALLTLSAEETPCVVQIFGADPRIMGEQAAGILDRRGDNVAMVDINMGCPVTKVVSKGQGAALMRQPEQAEAVVSAVVEACDSVPVSVKIRSGWSALEVNAVEFARRMEAAGAAAVAVHGRVRSAFYNGRADWDVVAAVKRAVSVPVIGSGDVFSAEDARAMLERTGVDAVMVARGAQGNPWIFREARALIDTGEPAEPPTAFERVGMAREHLAATIEFGGERAFKRMRKHVSWYTANLPGATYFRQHANRAASSSELDALLVEYRNYLEQRSARRAGGAAGATRD